METLHKRSFFEIIQINSLKSKFCQNKCFFTKNHQKAKKHRRRGKKYNPSSQANQDMKRLILQNINNLATSEHPSTLADEFNHFICVVDPNLAKTFNIYLKISLTKKQSTLFISNPQLSQKCSIKLWHSKKKWWNLVAK